MLFLIITFLVFFLLVYPNSINFTLTLLASSLLLLSSLVSASLLPSLSLFLVFLIYIGAMMVLIAYICAITPNLLLSPFLSFTISSIAFPFLMSALVGPLSESIIAPVQLPLTDFFYSPFGVAVLAFLLVFLFLVLLMVTTQHSNPNGPFRSLLN